MRPISYSSESGVILPMVLIFMIALTIVGLALLHATVLEHKLAMREVHRNQAFYLADGGIDHLTYKFNSGERPINWVKPPGEDYTVAVGETALGQGDYWVHYYDTSPAYAISTGRITKNPQEIIRRIRVNLYETSVFNFALFGDDGVSLDSNVIVDSYNSGLGGYPLTQSDNGDLGTNSIAPSAVSLDSNVLVYGDATIGPGGDVNEAITVLGSADIIGDELVASEEKSLPLMKAPDLTDRGSLFLGGSDTLTISESGSYSSFWLDSNAILTIDQDVVLHIEGEMRIDSNAQMIISGGANVTLYVGGQVSVGSNGIVNESQQPSSFSFIGLASCDAITLDSNIEFYGAVYAPNARVEINSNADLYGSFVGNEIVCDSNAGLHYDEALGVGTTITTVGLRNWQELF